MRLATFLLSSLPIRRSMTTTASVKLQPVVVGPVPLILVVLVQLVIVQVKYLPRPVCSIALVRCSRRGDEESPRQL